MPLDDNDKAWIEAKINEVAARFRKREQHTLKTFGELLFSNFQQEQRERDRFMQATSQVLNSWFAEDSKDDPKPSGGGGGSKNRL